jgi:glycosyltransferase involved in cell wall biosynthesis
MAAPGTLHAGAMPFPTVQGTQAAVRSMVEALAAAGRPTELLTYGHGNEGPHALPVRWHRLRNAVTVRSLRSGPSVGKLVLDAQMARALWRLGRRSPRMVVVAHHVEACAAAVAAGVHPRVFVAHTALGPELPTYFPRHRPQPWHRLGDSLEGFLSRRVDAVAAITPALARHMERTHRVRARPLVVPWTVPPPLGARERTAARRALRLPPSAPVALYAGNLDAYQGWEDVVEALADVTAHLPDARLLVATHSDATALLARATAAGVAARIHIAPLGDESDRRAAHAAADVAMVPRRTAGGLPIKLLDAMARGLPVVTTRRATAGLPIDRVTLVVRDDDGAALSHGWHRLASAPGRARDLAQQGRAHVATEHGADRFVRSFDAVIAAATVQTDASR